MAEDHQIGRYDLGKAQSLVFLADRAHFETGGRQRTGSQLQKFLIDTE
jgi:hypothetical protein